MIGYAIHANSEGLFNDFYEYWAAVRVDSVGGNPYDNRALADALAPTGLRPTLGSGYSYPLALLFVLRPMGWMEPHAAALVFLAAGMVSLGLAVAITGYRNRELSSTELLVGAGLAALSLPIGGSLFFGQANVVLLPLLAFAYRGTLPGGMLALVSAVKLYPLSGLAALLVRGRAGIRSAALSVGAFALLTLGPELAHRPGDAYRKGLALLGPDSYWTNQSINGWLSRTAVPTGDTVPVLPGLPVLPVDLVLITVLGLGMVWVLWRGRAAGLPGALCLALCFGVVAAPKNSLWNYTPLAFAFVYAWPRTRDTVSIRALLVMAFALIEIQGWASGPRLAGHASAWITLSLDSVALYGALLLGATVSLLLLRDAERISDAGRAEGAGEGAALQVEAAPTAAGWVGTGRAKGA